MGREGQGIIWTGGKDMDGTNTYRWIGKAKIIFHSRKCYAISSG